MPRKAKPPAAQRHSRASAPEHDDDDDSGPEQGFKHAVPARSQLCPGGMTKGRAGHPQCTSETPEQRMLRRMEAGPSDDEDDASDGSLQDTPGSSDGHSSDGGGSEAPSDDSAAQPSDTDDSDGNGGDGHSRDGDSGAGPSFESDIEDVPFEELAARHAVFRTAAPHPLSGGRRSSKHGIGSGGGVATDAAAGAAVGKGMAGTDRGRKLAPHRENKNRPAEQSSRRPVGRLRDVLQAPKTVGKDPRFEALSGAFNQDRFRKQYSFVFDEQLPAERSSLKSAMKKVRSADKREVLAAEAARIEGQLREDAARQKKRKFEQSLKAKEREAVKAGKKPFFLKKSDKRRAELVAKYEELKSTGRLEKYMAKRRRKNAAKDHRYIPGASRDGE